MRPELTEPRLAARTLEAAFVHCHAGRRSHFCCLHARRDGSAPSTRMSFCRLTLQPFAAGATHRGAVARKLVSITCAVPDLYYPARDRSSGRGRRTRAELSVPGLRAQQRSAPFVGSAPGVQRVQRVQRAQSRRQLRHSSADQFLGQAAERTQAPVRYAAARLLTRSSRAQAPPRCCCDGARPRRAAAPSTPQRSSAPVRLQLSGDDV